jgi:putative aminopeptidase FrvX
MSQIDKSKLIEIYALPKNTLHKEMVAFLIDNDYEVSHKPGEYIYAKPKTNKLSILLSAHMDTINDKYGYGDIKIDEIVCNGNIISVKKGVNKVLGGDDRNGVYLIKKLIEDGFRPYVILTHDEETGGAGVRSFLNDFPKNKDDIKLGIAIDRGYKVNKDNPSKLPEKLNQVVFYEEKSTEVHSYFESKGFVEGEGTGTDIKKIGATAA